MKKNILALFVISSLLVHEISSGVACYGECCLVCTAMGPFKFAAAFGVVLDITGCAAMCMAACALGAFVPPACLSEEMKISVYENQKIIEKNITEIKRNDLILTYKDEKPTFTKVISNIKTEGEFEFIEFKLSQGEKERKITVTDNHSMIVFRKKGKYILYAKNVEKGDYFKADDGLYEVKQISKMTLQNKYTLTTEEGTALTSGIFVSTICESEIKENISFEEAISKWRKGHHFISTDKDKPIGEAAY